MNRSDLVREFLVSEHKTTAPYIRKLSTNQLKREYAKQDQLLDTYRDTLPALPVSRCTTCGKVLEYALDAEGLDGMWWRQDGIVGQRAPDEEHFRVMLGAIDFQGRQPVEAKVSRRVRPGPGAPFVIARLLQMKGMQAVISSMVLPEGDLAYLIAYFSPHSVNPNHLHQPWARELLTVKPTEDQRGGWGLATDPWDFELRPWIDAGKLKWIEPGDTELVIRDSGPCPYLDLPGVRFPQLIEMGKIRTLPLPDGKPFDPFD